MTASTFFVSNATIRYLKSAAKKQTNNLISSSHLSEGIAAALGFKTYAALRSQLNQCETVEVSKPNNANLIQRLEQIGYSNLPLNLKLLPELAKSYTPFKTFPLRKQKEKGVRWYAWRNIVVAAINAGLEQGLYGLSPGQNYWSGASPDFNCCMRGAYQFTFNSNIPATASVDAVNGDELSFCVILNPTQYSQPVPQSFEAFRDGDAFAHCWLERRLGVWMQDGGEFFNCRRSLTHKIATLKIEPNGYSDQGSFLL